MEFSYQAKNNLGQLVEGKVEAPNEDQAVLTLHQKNLLILSLDAAQNDLFSKDLLAFFSRPSKKDVVIFTRQLATLIDADVPLVEGLNTLAKQIEKPSFKKVVLEVANSIEGGASLSVALAEHGRIFSGFYISLVKSGEVSGKLQATLLYMADYLERSAALTSKIRGALSYPAFVVFAIIAVSIIMMTSVLPQLLSIIKDSGNQELPISTRILVSVSNFFNNYIILILIAIVALVALAVHYMRTDEGKARFDRFVLVVPEFGKIIRNFYLARFSESLSTLIKSGVPILEALNITSEIVGNSEFSKAMLEAKVNVQGGGTVSEVFQKYEVLFPALVTSMLEVGEKTGRTDFMLDNINKFYKTETENSIQNLTAIIEPVIILFLGLAVGILVAAVLLPIYSLISTAG